MRVGSDGPREHAYNDYAATSDRLWGTACDAEGCVSHCVLFTVDSHRVTEDHARCVLIRNGWFHVADGLWLCPEHAKVTA